MIYNPLDEFYKSIIGSVKDGDQVIFRVKGYFDSVCFMFEKDFSNDVKSVEMIKRDGYFECSVSFGVGLYWYKFYIGNGQYIGFNKDSYLGEITFSPENFQLSVYDKDYNVPKWLNGGIIYQIFPDRFYCHNENKRKRKGIVYHTDKNDTPIFLPDENGKVLNNDFYGGDIKGIIDKLDYLKELNVSAIYLNPIFKANSNHRYDTGDYFEIDDMLGIKQDLIDLIAKAKEKDIKIILDGVFNHTGDDSKYFNKYGNYNSVGAYQSKDSPYYSWYSFTNYPDEYNSWWGVDILPSVNKNSKDFIDFITGDSGVIDYYTKMGIGGWRLDVVDELPKYFVNRIREKVKEVNKDAIIIGEVWEDASNKISYGVRREYFLGKELDSVMNYPLKNAIIDFIKTRRSKNLVNVINSQIDRYPKIVLNSLMNMLSTHDTVRIINETAGKDYSNLSKSEMAKVKLSGFELENAKFMLKVATLIQYTIYGVPTIYYGDEIGMQGLKDPLNRAYFTWDNIDEELLTWYKNLGEIRRSYSVFSDGDCEVLFDKDGVILYKRYGESGEVLTVINISEREYNLDFNGTLKNILDGKEYKNKIKCVPNSFYLLVNNG